MGCDDQDAVAAAPSDELGEDHADLDGFAKAHRVGQEDAGLGVVGAQCLFHRAELVGECVDEAFVGDGQRGRGEWFRGLAKRGFQPEAAAAGLGAVVGDQLGVRGADRLDWFEVGGELRGCVPHDAALAAHVQPGHAVVVVDGGDHPFLIPSDHGGTGDVERVGGGAEGTGGSGGQRQRWLPFDGGGDGEGVC